MTVAPKVAPHPERDCPGCNRGDKTITPPYTTPLGPGKPIHYPGGMICSKWIPADQWDALRKYAEMRKLRAGEIEVLK